MNEKILLIDGYSILTRAYYGVPDLTNSAGLHTNAVYGFCNIMFRILDEEQPEYLAVAFDVHAPTFRHQLYEQYKGTRRAMPEELHEQVPVLKDLLHAMGIFTAEQTNMEADDIIGTLSVICRQKGMEVVILSGDRDLLQLTADHVMLRIPKTKQGGTVIEDYRPEDVQALYHVTPREFIDVKALMGDSSDNIPGVPGIGEKTATALISGWHSLDNIYDHLDEIKPPRAQKALRENRELAYLSRELSTIRLDCELDFTPEEARLGQLYTDEAYEMCSQLEFRSLLSRFPDRASAGQNPEIQTTVIRDSTQAQSVLMKIAACQNLGLSVSGSADSGRDPAGRFLSVERAALFADNNIYILESSSELTSDFLKEKLLALIHTVCSAADGCVAVPDLKSILKVLEIPEQQGIWDVGVAAYLLNPLKNSYNYEDIARDYLGETLTSRSELFGRTAGKLSQDEILSRQRLAISTEARVSTQAVRSIRDQLQDTGMLPLYLDTEMPLVWCLDRMEKEGVRVEKKELEEYGRRLEEQINHLEQEIYEMTGEVFNINSPRQLGDILFEKMKIPGGRKTKTGYSTAADVLEKLAPDYPVVGKILEYRQLTKLKSTYADGLTSFIREDGRIHGTFNQTITATGRLSSTEPNLQNILVRLDLGREIRKVFVPREGCVFIDADYSQIELRVLAHMSGEEELIEAFRQTRDIHRLTASQIFHVPFDEVTPLQRRNAKAVNFGIIYGISAFGLSEDLSISRDEAINYINQYFSTYPKVREYLDGQVKAAKEQGYVTTVYGRRRPVPELSSSNFAQRSFGERVAMNSPIQGTAADIMKMAMIRVDRRLHSEGLKSRIILQVHDELIVEAPLDEKDTVRTLLEQEMSSAACLRVNLDVSVSCGSSWFETK